MSIGDFPEILSQAILVGIILVGRLGVVRMLQESELRKSFRVHQIRTPRILIEGSEGAVNLDRGFLVYLFT